ncbi:hypothetical protein MKZ38_008626 [Zalerion maritima]|uniref:Vacuolar protein sorting-associated protein 33A n=1 Tax=Zalerion maritima TaxID=339359 RepID=A0AAD5S0J2_9PEZI|nr:hypothetical protein MKZ38_008626 [Zalerion maritima]
MAPHAGFDTEQIRDKSRKDILHLLEGVPGKKNVVIERSLAGPIGLIVKVPTFRDYGIEKFFLLENNNVNTSQRNVVFIGSGECGRNAQTIAGRHQSLFTKLVLHPNHHDIPSHLLYGIHSRHDGEIYPRHHGSQTGPELIAHATQTLSRRMWLWRAGAVEVKVLTRKPHTLEQMKRLQRETQTGHEFHVFWVPRRTLVSDQIFEEEGVLGDANIVELPLNFFPLDKDVLSLELDESFHDLYLSKDHTPVFLLARALMGIQQKHGLFPRIIGKGDNARRVADLLSRMRQELLAGDEGHEGSRIGLTPSTTTESVIIIDREVDFLTPLLTQLTYKGLIDEVFGIQNNLTEVDSTIVGATAQSSASNQGSSAASENPSSRVRKIQLDSSDKLFSQLRDTNFAIVGGLLNKVARRLQGDFESRHTSKTTAELKEFVQKLPGLQADQQSLKIHTNLAEEIMKYTRTDQFTQLLEVQQHLAAGTEPSSQLEAIEELIARDIPLPEVLRLLCIYSCISGGIKTRDFDQFRRLVIQGYGYQHVLTLSNLEKLQLLLSKSSPLASMIPMPGSSVATGTKTNYTYLRKQLRLIVDEVNEQDPNDISYVYSGYAPLSVRLVQCVLQKRQLLSITHGNGVAAAASSGGTQGWRGFDEAVKHARGQTFDEVQKGEDQAVKARALLSGGGDKKTVFIVFVGGITFTEIAALRFIAKQEEGRRNLVICTTSIISGNKMMAAAIEKDSFTRDSAARPSDTS